MFHIVGERNEKFKTQIFAKSQKTRIERIRQSAVERYEQPLFFAFVLGIFSCVFHKKASCFGRRLRWRQKSSTHTQPFKEHKHNRHRYIPHKRQNVRSQKSSRDKIGDVCKWFKAALKHFRLQAIFSTLSPPLNPCIIGR